MKSTDPIVTFEFNKNEELFSKLLELLELLEEENFGIVCSLDDIIEAKKLPKPDNNKIKAFDFVKNNYGDIYLSVKKDNLMNLTDNNLLRLYKIYKMRKNMSPDELKKYAILDFDNYEYLICLAYYRLHRRKLKEMLSFEDTAKELDKLLFVKALKKQP